MLSLPNVTVESMTGTVEAFFAQIFKSLKKYFFCRKTYENVVQLVSILQNGFVRNLRILVVGQNVCPWQAFPA